MTSMTPNHRHRSPTYVFEGEKKNRISDRWVLSLLLEWSIMLSIYRSIGSFVCPIGHLWISVHLPVCFDGKGDGLCVVLFDLCYWLESCNAYNRNKSNLCWYGSGGKSAAFKDKILFGVFAAFCGTFADCHEFDYSNFVKCTLVDASIHHDSSFRKYRLCSTPDNSEVLRVKTNLPETFVILNLSTSHVHES